MMNYQTQPSAPAAYGARLSNKICPENMTVEEWQIALRRENAKEMNYEVEHLDENRIWGDYLVSGKTGRYRVAFRGVLSDRNYCSCLDFRTNGLGTCKHIEAVTLNLSNEVPGYPWANLTYNPPYSSLYISYKGGRSVRMRIGESRQKEFLDLRSEYFNDAGILPPENYDKIEEICHRGSVIDSTFRCYDDVFDFIRECRAKELWSESIRSSYPEEIIEDGFVYESTESLRRKVYQMAHRGYGLITKCPQQIATIEALALAYTVMVRYPENNPGYIIVDRYTDLHRWQVAMRNLSLSPAALILTTAQEFVKRLMGTPQRAIPFVYVDNADPLKEWRNPLSVVLKAATIDHLYMRIPTLKTLTPVQLSSILQHISPYILGPFYRFIHTYRPIFPLSDDGSNIPNEIRGFIFTHEKDEEAFGQWGGMEADHRSGDKITTNDRVQYFLDAMNQLLEDPEALYEIRTLLKQLPRR